MKKIFIPLMLAIVAIFIYSCKKEEIILTPITNSGSEVSFSAAIGEDQQTKTTFNDQTLKLFWKSNDKVYIWHKEANSGTGALGTYKASADGAQTNLDLDGGTSLQWVEGANTFSSVYVCNSTSEGQSGDNFTISLPAIQTQSQANNTDHFGDYMAMKGYLSTTHTGVENVGNVDIHFSPLYSVLEFAFPYDADKKVTKVEAEIISEEGDQDLAFETANVSKNDNSTEITGLTTPSKKVTLNITTQMDLSKGISKAWMIVKPGTYGSIKFTYTYATGDPDTKDYTNVTIERGTRYNITTYGNIVRNTANADDNTSNTIATAITNQLGDGALTTITSLKVIGTMNEADFVTLKNMTTLATLDLSDVRVVGDIKIGYNYSIVGYITQSGNAIPIQAFGKESGNTTLKSILLPKSITTIGEGAFASCAGLTGNLTLPSTITTIGEGAFYGCTGFYGNLTIPSTVTTIGMGAFEDCTGFYGNLTIPSTVTTIGMGAFYNCSNLTSLSLNWVTGSEIPTYSENMFPSQFIGDEASGIVIVPEGCESIYTSREDGWQNLNITKVVNNTANAADNTDNTLENAIKAQLHIVDLGTITSLKVTGTMNEADFYFLRDYMSTLATLDLSDVRVVGDIKIGYNYSIEDYITQSGNAIPYEAFIAKTSLRSILLPKNITTIGSDAFEDCTGLNGILSIPEGVETIGDLAFYSCTGLTGNLTIPSTVSTIGYSAFEDCTGFNGTLTIPEGVEIIGNQAFYSCTGLTGNLTIPSTVTTIGMVAFYNCSNLTSLSLNWVIGSEIPTYSNNMFPSQFIVYEASGIVTVPVGYKSLYMGKDGWQDLNIPQEN